MFRMAWILLLVAGILLPGDVAVAASRFAVLVGVGAYDPASAIDGIPKSAGSGSGIDLKGPPNDLALMAEVLAYYGFDDRNSVVLADAQATRDGIINAVKTNLLSLEPGSLAVFYFSGHGSALKGKDKQGEWNDETIVPYDGRVAGQPPRDIVDDEIYSWIEQLAQRSVASVFIFDSCFSGGGARAADVKALPPVSESVRPADRDGTTSFRARNLPNPLQRSSAVVLAASDANEPARSTLVKGQFQSVFTTALRNTFIPADQSFVPPVKWTEVASRVASALKLDGNSAPIQTPHVFGTVDAPVFDSRGPFSNSVRATRISPKRASIAAGSDLGVTEGSVFKLFGDGQVPWRSSKDFEAKAKVAKVTAYDAELEVIEKELSSDVLAAVEFEYAIPEYKIKVRLPARGQIDPFDRAAIVSGLGRFAEIADGQAELTVASVNGRLQLATMEGREVGAPVELGDSERLRIEFARRFADYVRWKRLMTWKRPGLGSPKIRYRMALNGPDGTKVLDEDSLKNAPIPAGGSIRLLVENRASQKIKVDAVLLQPNYTIDVCPVGVLETREELATEWVQLPAQAGAAAWKIVVSDPAQNLSLLFLNSESGARSATASLESEFAGIWNGASAQSRGQPASESFWRTLDMRFDVAASAAVPGAGSAAKRCIGLPQK